MQRYVRQMALPEMGEAGQQRIREAKVLIVGVGGLGSPIALYLTAAGVGTIGLVDEDVVSLSNLQRQVLYTEAEVGLHKVDCAVRRLQALNGDTQIRAHRCRLDENNARELIADYDIVVDGCDNFATRYLLSDVCAELHKPYVYGAIAQYTGQVCVLCGEHGRTYRDLFGDDNRDTTLPPTAAEKAVMGTTPAIVGSVEANEVLKLVTGVGTPLVNRLWSIDLRTMESTAFECCD